MSQMNLSRTGGSAVVIGGGIAGLLAARVLAGHYEQVTLVERDSFPIEPGPRNGVPQARHVHILLSKGQRCLEQLFPGLQDELGQSGAPALDWVADSCWFMFGGWAPRFPSGFIYHACSRDLLEWLIRRRLSAFPQVQFLQEYEVVDLLSDLDKVVIKGVKLRPRNQPGARNENLPAALVVDASGRESHAPGWLENLGYPPPKEDVVNSFLGYASRVYQKPPGEFEWQSLLVRGTPPDNKRGGVINPIEGGCWIVTLGASGRDYPPIEESGFLEFARSLPVPTLYDAIKNAQPLTPISGYRKTENRWRRFGMLVDWPENFVVMGDAACTFNPVYGQGMTIAAQEALLLDERLRLRSTKAEISGFALGVQQDFARLISRAWLLATGEDYRFPETEGRQRSFLTRLMHGYTDRVMRASLRDPQVFITFLKVAHLLKPPLTLFQPEVFFKALILSNH